MTTQTTPTIEVSKIDVEEGFNARSTMEADGIARLSASIATEGLIQPILVKAGDERPRHRDRRPSPSRRGQARRTSSRCPSPTTRASASRPASLVENLHREDLDPIDAARGLKAIAEEFGLTTNKDIAAQVNMSVAVGGRAAAPAEAARGLPGPDRLR